MIKLIVLQFSALVSEVAVGNIKELDLDNALFYMGVDRNYVYGLWNPPPEVQNPHDISTSDLGKQKAFKDMLLNALKKAESEDRIIWTIREKRNLNELSGLLKRFGIEMREDCIEDREFTYFNVHRALVNQPLTVLFHPKGIQC